VVDGHARIDRDAKTADAGVERQARTSRWRQELDLRIESPAAEPAPRATMYVGVSPTLRQDRRESVGNGCQSTAECIEGGEAWPALSSRGCSKNNRPSTLRGETPRSVVGSHTKAAHLRTP
jgi:hypothetical protein